MSFLNQGITFTVYGRREGTERIFPYDLLPRIVTNAEWTRIEQGLIQRITAFNLFLKDIYNDGKILADGVVPREVVYSCKQFRRQMRGLQVPRDVYVAIVGSDLVRLPSWRVRSTGRQSARSERRKLHAHQPPRDEANLPATLSAVWRETDRTLHPGAVEHVAIIGARGSRRADDRLCSPRESITRRISSTLTWPARWASSWSKVATSDPRQQGLYADDYRVATSRRDLSPGGR